MSDQTPQGDFSPGFDDPAPSRGLDGRALRALIAGAAGVAVLGAFTGGYLWVSSSPSAETASAVTPGVANDSTPTGTSTSAASGFAFGGSDLFDDSFLPKDTVVAAGSTSTSAGTTTAAPSSSVPIVVSTPSQTKDVGKGAGVGATPNPTTPAPVTATPTKSALPSWEISHYYFKEKAANNIDAVFVTQYTDNHGGYETRATPGTVLYPADLTFVGLVKDMAHLHNNRGLDDGWYVPAGAALPDAGMGGSDKQLRLSGLRNSEVFFFQVDRGPSVQVAKGDVIPGTDFTVEGLTVDGISEDGDNYFYVTDSNGVYWYGTVGGGEDAGLLF